MSWRKHLTKLCKKCLPHIKYVLALVWEIWSDRLSGQRSTYMCILMNHWIATNTTGSYCLKNRHMCSRSHHLYITCSKCLYLQHERIHVHASATSPTACSMNSVIQTVLDEYVISVRRHLRSRDALEADNSSMYCKDDVNYYTFDDFLDNYCQSCLWLNDSLKCAYKYRVNGSICHLKFPKLVMLAHILGEVNTFCIA